MPQPSHTMTVPFPQIGIGDGIEVSPGLNLRCQPGIIAGGDCYIT
jgi:hypothetical protein